MHRYGILQPSLYHPKEDRGLAPSPQPLPPQPILESTTIQDGNPHPHLPDALPQVGFLIGFIWITMVCIGFVHVQIGLKKSDWIQSKHAQTQCKP